MTSRTTQTQRKDAMGLQRFNNQGTVLLTTFRRNGSPVSTPISIAVEDDRAFMRSYASAGKMKRLRRNQMVEVAPATFRGKATGPAIRARARILSDEESRHAARLLARKYPVLQGIVVPVYHRLRGLKTVHFELEPVNSRAASN